jgi:hypothetical protein
MRWRRLQRLIVACTVVAAALPVASDAGAPAPRSAVSVPASFPAAGELLQAQVAVRVAPHSRGVVVRILHEFRSDYRFQVVLALAARRLPTGEGGSS